MINKMIKKYNDFLNEKLSDKLGGFTEDEAMKKLNLYSLSPNDMLVKCAYYNIISGMELALKNGADIHYNKEKALYSSIEKKQYNAVKFLIEHGANTHIDGNQPLYSAIIEGDLEIFKLLLETVNINEETELILGMAISEESYDIIKYCLTNLKIKITKDIGKDIDTFKRHKYGNYYTFKIMLDYEENIDNDTVISTYNPNDMLLYGVKYNELEIVKIAFEKGAEIISNFLILMFALYNNNFDMIDYLFSKGLIIKNEYLEFIKNKETVNLLQKYIK
jgi:ankyrin repeat protein